MMSTMELIPIETDDVDTFFTHLISGTDETAVPIVSSTTGNMTHCDQQGRRNSSRKLKKEVPSPSPSSSSNNMNELVKSFPDGRISYGPIIVRPRKKAAKTLLTGRRSKYEVLQGDAEERRRARRERNRLAATKCRDKREKTFQELELSFIKEENRRVQLEKHVEELEQRREQLLSIIASHSNCLTMQVDNILRPTNFEQNENLLINSTFNEEEFPSDLQFLFQQPSSIQIPIEMNTSSFERLVCDLKSTVETSSSTSLYNSSVPSATNKMFY